MAILNITTRESPTEIPKQEKEVAELNFQGKIRNQIKLKRQDPAFISHLDYFSDFLIAYSEELKIEFFDFADNRGYFLKRTYETD